MYRNNIMISTTCLILFSNSISQAWIARYNGPASLLDKAKAIIVDNNGYIYVTGNSWVVTGCSYGTIKYDSLGNVQWLAHYQGPAMLSDALQALAIGNNGYVFITGISENTNHSTDYATVAYDSNGNEMWAVRYNGPANEDDYALDLCTDSLNNVYVTGISYGLGTDRDFATVKYSVLGETLWVARYNGPGNYMDQASAIAIDGLCNVYVTGNTLLGSNSNFATVKYDSAGVQQWVAIYDSPFGLGDAARNIVLDNMGNIYVSGISEGVGTYNDYLIVSYDSAGAERWTRRYNGPGNGDDFCWALALDSESNIYVTGCSYSDITGNDYATIKYDSVGHEQWIMRYNGTGMGHDEAWAIAVDAGYNIYVTGISDDPSSAEDYATIKYDSLGNEKWIARYNGPGNGYDEARAIAVDNMACVYVTGGSEGIGTDQDFATIKYYPTSSKERSLSRVKLDYKNPTILSGPLLLPDSKDCRVFDVMGRVIMPDKIKSGIYFIEIDNIIIQKIIKLR